MNEISIGNLPERAFTSEPIFLDKNYILLSPETPLIPSLKRRLEEWGFAAVYADVEPEFTELSINEETEGLLLKKAAAESEEENEAVIFYRELTQFMLSMFSVEDRKEPKLVPVTDKVKKLIGMMKTHKEFLLNLADFGDTEGDYSVSQSVKTAILAIAMSETLRFPAHKQMDLGVAALMHRIGVMQIPRELFFADRALTPEERKNISLFPVLGYRTLKAAEFPLPIILAVLEHRENIDGSGYPRGLTGDKISLYGKILAVASSYCAAVSKRPFRENMDGHSGIIDLLKDRGTKYDEKILRVLLLTLTVYPIGTYVRMSDGSIGIVYQTNSEEPKFPVLKMLFDANNRLYAEMPILHTSAADEVQIKRALTKDEVESLRLDIEKK